MTEKFNSTISGQERIDEAINVLIFATELSKKIDPNMIPATKIDSFNPYTNGYKDLAHPINFFNNWRKSFWSMAELPTDVWVLSKEIRPEEIGILRRPHLVISRLMLGASGVVVEHNRGKNDDYFSYKILDEQNIKNPREIYSLLSRFVNKRSVKM